MRKVMKWVLRITMVIVLVVIGLLSPVAYNEFACQKPVVESKYTPMITDQSWQRDEGRTLLTYPEWHIVHAYDDYAKVIREGHPHDYRFLKSIGGFWTSLCDLTKMSAHHGGFTTESKQTIYTIGVSFTAELLLKAAYEESVGRVFTWFSGDTRAPLDDLSTDQAAKYAKFLQQIPWYKWDFQSDKQALRDEATSRLRDRERKFALGIEYGVKSKYAKVIEAAVEGIGADKLIMRTIVSNMSDEQLQGIQNVKIISTNANYTIIETPRYRVFTHIALEIANAGGDFVEIAGNDDIMFTAIGKGETPKNAISILPRQGYNDARILEMVKVTDLADVLRRNTNANYKIEHIHDY